MVLVIPGLVIAGSLGMVEYGIHSAFANASGASAAAGIFLEVFFGVLAFGFVLLASICLGGPLSTAIREYALIFYGGRYQALGDILVPPPPPPPAALRSAPNRLIMATLRRNIVVSLFFTLFGGPALVLGYVPWIITHFRIPPQEPPGRDARRGRADSCGTRTSARIHHSIHLGWPWHPRAGVAARTPRGKRTLPLCTQSHVRGRPHCHRRRSLAVLEPRNGHLSCGGLAHSPSLRLLIRGAKTHANLSRRVRALQEKCPALAAPHHAWNIAASRRAGTFPAQPVSKIK